jgi:hypothetical protein
LNVICPVEESFMPKVVVKANAPVAALIRPTSRHNLGAGGEFASGRSTWKVKQLWKAAQHEKVFYVNVAKLTKSRKFRTTGIDDLSTVQAILSHLNRIRHADLTKPIIFEPDGWIADGTHRVLKAWLLGVRLLPAVRFRTMPPPRKRSQRAR